MGVVGLHGDHHSGEFGDPASQRRGTGWTRLFADQADLRRPRALVSKAGGAGNFGFVVGVDPQHYLLVGVAMGLDIRLPIGLLFSVIGLLLMGFGVFGDKAIYQRSLGLNVNLAWGAVLLVFGAIMVLLARRGRAIAPKVESSTGGSS